MAKGNVQIRDVSPILQLVRNFLLGRKHTLAVRFEPQVATRSPPLPNLPEGPSHLLNNNYYCKRDARREIAPPLEITTQKLLQDGLPSKSATPGKIYRWD